MDAPPAAWQAVPGGLHLGRAFSAPNLAGATWDASCPPLAAPPPQPLVLAASAPAQLPGLELLVQQQAAARQGAARRQHSYPQLAGAARQAAPLVQPASPRLQDPRPQRAAALLQQLLGRLAPLPGAELGHDFESCWQRAEAAWQAACAQDQAEWEAHRALQWSAVRHWWAEGALAWQQQLWEQQEVWRLCRATQQAAWERRRHQQQAAAQAQGSGAAAAAAGCSSGGASPMVVAAALSSHTVPGSSGGPQPEPSVGRTEPSSPSGQPFAPVRRAARAACCCAALAGAGERPCPCLLPFTQSSRARPHVQPGMCVPMPPAVPAHSTREQPAPLAPAAPLAADPAADPWLDWLAE